MTTHGLYVGGRQHKLYSAWARIKQRCFNPNNPRYSSYGGRGITMHEPWVNDAAAFAAYLESLPHYGEEGVSIDRINVNGNYEPGNLRWATAKEQALNMRSNVRINHDGESLTLSEWSERAGLARHTIAHRIKRGLTGADLVAPRQLRGPLYEHNGVKKTITQWAKETGVSRTTLQSRVRNNKPPFKEKDKP